MSVIARCFRLPTPRAAPVVALLVCGVVFTAPVAAQAQENATGGWKELQFPEPPNGRREATRMLRSGVTDAALFTQYYQFRLAEFTLVKNKDELKRLRDVLKRELQSAARDPHDRINQLALDMLPDVALDPAFHPAARVNAMLILGDLNAEEPQIGRGGMGVPLPEGLEAMLGVLDKLGANDGASDALRLAATVMIARHIEGGAANQPQMKQRLADLLTATVREQQPPQGRSVAAHAFMRARAALALADMGLEDREAAAAVTAVAQLLDENDSPLWVRGYAVESLASMNLASADNMNIRDLLRRLGELVIAAGKADGQTPLGIGVYLSKVQQCAQGFTNLAPADKEVVDQFTTHLDGMIATMNDVRSDDTAKLKRLKDQADAMGAWLKQV